MRTTHLLLGAGGALAAMLLLATPYFVRAQTQVRLGALWISSKKNPRIGRRYLASAVAINPAVKLPSEMTTPKVRKALHQVRAKAQPAGPAPTIATSV